MVKNNASTHYDVTEKTITPMVRAEGEQGCGWLRLQESELRG